MKYLLSFCILSLVLIIQAGQLEQNYFGINIPLGPNTSLPSNSTQAFRFYGNGTQHYYCTTTDNINYSWLLKAPVADLFAYNGNTIDFSTKIGSHYFNTIGNNGAEATSPCWDFGVGCVTSATTYLSSCQTPAGRWCGEAPVTDPQTGTLTLLRASKDELLTLPVYSNPSFYNQYYIYNYIQRVSSEGGVAPAASTCSAANLNEIRTVSYKTDYIFAFTSFPQVSVPAAVALPSNCFQGQKLFGSGTQNYRCASNAWILREVVANLEQYSSLDEQVLASPSRVVGRHGFVQQGLTSNGLSPFWQSGTNCGNAPCITLNGEWIGQNSASSPTSGNSINLLLFQKNNGLMNSSTNITISANYLNRFSLLQRLNPVGGVAPPVVQCNTTNEGEIRQVSFTADYYFAFCAAAVTPLPTATRSRTHQPSETRFTTSRTPQPSATSFTSSRTPTRFTSSRTPTRFTSSSTPIPSTTRHHSSHSATRTASSSNDPNYGTNMSSATSFGVFVFLLVGLLVAHI